MASLYPHIYPFKGAAEELVRAVWNKGRPIPNSDPAVWRSDIRGAVMKYSEHGEATQQGWEIDHIKPVSRGGPDALENLQPLQWQNNRAKGESYPWS